MPAELTGPQRRTLAFIVRRWGETGSYPTLREISRGLGFASASGANCHLVALEKKGYIRRGSNTARGIVVPALAEAARAAANIYLRKLERGAARG